MENTDTGWIADLIQQNNVHAFYTSRQWERTRLEVLVYDKYECQLCKARGKYTKAVMVHHVSHLRTHPGLALSMWYTDECGNQCRQLLSLCERCHELQHPERLRRRKKHRPLTPERW